MDFPEQVVSEIPSFKSFFEMSQGRVGVGGSGEGVVQWKENYPPGQNPALLLTSCVTLRKYSIFPRDGILLCALQIKTQSHYEDQMR